MDLWTPARALLGAAPDRKAPSAAALAVAEPAIHARQPYTRLTHGPAASHMRALGGAEASDWVYDCVRLVAESVAQADVVYRSKAGGDAIEDPDRRAGRDGKFRGLFELTTEPNPWVTWPELLELLVYDLMVVGNAYWLKFNPTSDGRAAAIYRLQPEGILVEPGEEELIKRYLYQISGMPEPEPFDPFEIIHFRLPNPHDAIFGMGIIQAGPRAVDVDLGLTETMARYYEQGAKVAGVVETDRSVPDPVRKKIQRQFQAHFGGASRSWQVPFLERGLKWQAVGADAQHAAFEAMSRLGRDRTAALCHVPVPLLDGGAGGGNVVQAQEHFDNKTVRPFLKRIEAVINRDLAAPFGIDIELQHETVIPETDRIAAAGEFAKLPGVTVSEVRERAGLEPLDDDEVNEIVLNLPMPSTEGNLPGAGPDQPLPGEAGRPPNPENTQPIEQPVPAVNGREPTPSDRRRMQRVGKDPMA